MGSILQDIRYALRSLRSSRGFAAAVIVSMALGIGATTAIFSAVYGVLLRPLPYRDADRLAILSETFASRGMSSTPFSWPSFASLRERTQTFSAVAAASGDMRSLSVNGQPERVAVGIVTPGYFSLLGVPLVLGREPSTGEAVYGAHRVAVLSASLFEQRFGSDPTILGRSIHLNGQEFLVIGVAPRGIALPYAALDVYVPLAFAPNDQLAVPGRHYLQVVGRLAPGATMEAARAELTRIADDEAAAHGENQGVGMVAVALRQIWSGPFQTGLLVLLGAVGLVILITCANLANLVLARGMARQQELAVRAALGARRGRLVRQLLTESVVLATIGGLLGLGVGAWLLDAMLALAPEALRILPVSIDGTVLAFALGLSLATAVGFTLWPALRATRVASAESLRDGARTTGGKQRLRQGLMAIELALSLVLLVGAGLLLRSFAHLGGVDLGFRPEGVITASIELGVRGPDNFAKIRRTMDAILHQIEAVPGVGQAGLVSFVPLGPGGLGNAVTVEGHPATRLEDVPILQYRLVAGDAFGALGIPLKSGRLLAASDGAGAPKVIVVNQAAARFLFGDAEPIGQRVYLGPPEGLTTPEMLKSVPPGLEPFQRLTVVGVVGDVRANGPGEPASPEMYQTWEQSQGPSRGANIVLRSGLPLSALAAAMRAAVARVDSDLPLADVKPLTAYLGESVAETRFQMTLLSGFATLATLLALLGVYGVMSFLVSQRMRELGIRVALGATGRDILALVVGKGVRWVLVGLGGGVLAALGFSQVLASLLFGVSALDPWTFASAALLLGGAALVALYVPARRAARVDPLTVMKAD